MTEIETEMISNLKSSLKNKSSNILNSMIERFQKEFNLDASGAVRNWKIYEDEEFKKYFI